MLLETSDTLPSLFPSLFRNHYECQIGSGWISIAIRCLGQIEGAARQVGLKGEEFPLVVCVKEKFGALRIYHERGPFLLYRFTEEAEKASLSICEDCGISGNEDPTVSLETISPGRISWLKTLCQACRVLRIDEWLARNDCSSP